jgi:Protein of unknown function (DUF3618)
MAARPRTPDEVRRDIAAERDELSRSVESLREEVGKATDIAGKLRANLAAAAGGALGVGFVLAGGIGATMRWLARRGREGDEVATIGRFKIVDRG